MAQIPGLLTTLPTSFIGLPLLTFSVRTTAGEVDHPLCPSGPLRGLPNHGPDAGPRVRVGGKGRGYGVPAATADRCTSTKDAGKLDDSTCVLIHVLPETTDLRLDLVVT